MSTVNELQSLFLRLAAVDGVSLRERNVADAVTAWLHPYGIRTAEDGAAAALGGTCGNLFCFPPDFDPAAPAIMLTAHLDTVLPTANLKPRVTEDRIASDGTTILGGDNRFGLSVLTMLLRETAERRLPHRNFFVVHTVAEEITPCGADHIDLAPYRVQCAYVFDSSRRPGVYIGECVGLHSFKASVHGKSAHSGVAPEEGVNAIRLAAKAIMAVELGRVDGETTANIGLIRGGEATNAVPARVDLEGEVRSYRPERIHEQLRRIERTLRDTVEPAGTVTFESMADFEPYTLLPDDPMILSLERAMRRAGLTPQPIRYTGGSDANKYNALGVPAVNLGVGAQKPHSFEEFVLVEDIVKTYELARELIRPDA